MLLMRLRVRPCSDRLSRSSLGRLIVIALPSDSIFMFGCGAISSLPLGPSTRTLPSAMFTLTPPGMATGCLPIRDMAHLPLPHIANQLAAEPLGAGLPVAHDAAVGADDRNPQAIQDRPQVAMAAINPTAGLADALDVPDDALSLGSILEVDAQDLLGAGLVGRRV